MKSLGPVALVILDGFGYAPKTAYNAIAQAYTPYLDAWFATYPWTLLDASGTHVGLLSGDVGNSEVGHLTLGAGRIIPQPLTCIDATIANGTFSTHPVLVHALQEVKKHTGRLHIIGLCSDAHVHSALEHMYALLQAAQISEVPSVFLHLILDGRDVVPQSAAVYLKPLTEYLQKTDCGIIGSLHGRFYAMDRGNNFDRTEKSYAVLVGKEHSTSKTWQEVLSDAYHHNLSDEFIEPVLLDEHAAIQPGDGIILFNIRPDRIMQLAERLVHLDVSCFVTFVDYGLSQPTHVLFQEPSIVHTLKDTLAQAHKRMFVIAETEKYAHVTYFFTGMRHEAVQGETRVLIPSLKLRTYEQHPEMSAPKITQAVLATMHDPYDFYLINYANADMVGHSGNLQATSAAIECLDAQLGLLYEAFVIKHHGILFITADHGKAEEMFDPLSGQPKTAHTHNKVPLIMLSAHRADIAVPSLSELKDVAPFIIRCMGLSVPDEMKV